MYRKRSETSSLLNQALYFPRWVVKDARAYETKGECVGKRNPLCTGAKPQFGAMQTWESVMARRAAVVNRQSVKREQLDQAWLLKGWRAGV